ncbi:hypothetical protein IW261DRAFT_1419800 [Armillaria novae-zelandiae]|uniref:Uncharacterized protein n=1 Tax=Armillaria novae-zelandiae TaxID=153914 RepID=A0AA39P8U6_9AGAR|nr:hypothetical protein IW261DRAFT_1625325 [Armillaria novae-zelandiae]KAK0479720.1 hypothetical protein IW261DRAFT_1419796 [Armillaria novae-zelandiae]KAK0479723.1 hypothetical protein IW261DRAFT_1419798 [Armillaria novae-zelandiae]KAK0479726.1 hypothetical protein IW261DRAFT_1419800 [Armillaria novae-zelandiae]
MTSRANPELGKELQRQLMPRATKRSIAQKIHLDLMSYGDVTISFESYWRPRVRDTRSGSSHKRSSTMCLLPSQLESWKLLNFSSLPSSSHMVDIAVFSSSNTSSVGSPPSLVTTIISHSAAIVDFDLDFYLYHDDSVELNVDSSAASQRFTQRRRSKLVPLMAHAVGIEVVTKFAFTAYFIFVFTSGRMRIATRILMLDGNARYTKGKKARNIAFGFVIRTQATTAGPPMYQPGTGPVVQGPPACAVEMRCAVSNGQIGGCLEDGLGVGEAARDMTIVLCLDVKSCNVYEKIYRLTVRNDASGIVRKAASEMYRRGREGIVVVGLKRGDDGGMRARKDSRVRGQGVRVREGCRPKACARRWWRDVDGRELLLE